MKTCLMLAVLLALGSLQVQGRPASPATCDSPETLSAAKLALDAINRDRMEGYRFDLYRVANIHTHIHGEAGIVFYLNMDVVETNCSALNKDASASCVARELDSTPVYGQCKAAIYISKIHRVVRLYKYKCLIRPFPASKIHEVCPDCPTLVAADDAAIKEIANQAVEKFNREGGLSKRFALLKVERASSGMAMNMYYNVEFTIRETVCRNDTTETDNCPFLECEFTHNGFCTASMFMQEFDKKEVTVHCDVFESEASEREKKLHLLADTTDHKHNDTHAHDHTTDHTHDHEHDHTKPHSHAHTHKDSAHHHTHTHPHDHSHDHAHDHSHDHAHDHGHGHDHVHAHHDKAHDHTGDFPHQHHDYKHAAGVHTHEHDHELALDHDHRHAHLHEHEHHHHHHDHDDDHHHPEGVVKTMLSMDHPVTLPVFPTPAPEVGVPLVLKPDPKIPGVSEPPLGDYPTALSPNCPSATPENTAAVAEIFANDPVFKVGE